MRTTIAALLLPALLASGPAWAQAFTQAKGEGRVIASIIHSNSDKAFDDNGHVQDIPDYRQTEIYLLGEYGVTDDLTLLLTPSFRDVSVKGAPDSTGLGFTDIGARYRLAHGDRGVFSIQAVARIPGKKRADILAQVGQTDMEYDLRGQGAVTWTGGFAIFEGGYRFRAGDPPNQFNLDATLGVRAAPKLLLLASSYNAISDGSGQGVFRRYRYHNLYLSAAYDVAPKVTLQLGALGTLAGRNALRQRGVFGGVWFRF